MMNSKLENIFLNMLINSNESKRKGVFDIYLDEMKKLETDGFTVTVDGVDYKIFVVVVQVIGDNLGLNGLLGYVESFTANFPCRLCKVLRTEFNDTFVEIGDILVSMMNDNIYPSFRQIKPIFITDCKDCFLVCNEILTG